MTGDKKTLKYIEGCSRCDKKTHDMLENLLRNGKVSTYFEPINKKLDKNIYYLNKMRIEATYKTPS